MENKEKNEKISREFLSRLTQLDPNKLLRVILMINYNAKKTRRAVITSRTAGHN